MKQLFYIVNIDSKIIETFTIILRVFTYPYMHTQYNYAICIDPVVNCCASQLMALYQLWGSSDQSSEEVN